MAAAPKSEPTYFLAAAEAAGAGAAAAVAASFCQVPLSARHAFLVLVMSMLPSDCLQWWVCGEPPLAGADAGVAANANEQLARAADTRAVRSRFVILDPMVCVVSDAAHRASLAPSMASETARPCSGQHAPERVSTGSCGPSTRCK